MTSIREQHERAMELADFAFAAKRVNDRETAARLFHDAWTTSDLPRMPRRRKRTLNQRAQSFIAAPRP